MGALWGSYGGGMGEVWGKYGEIWGRYRGGATSKSVGEPKNAKGEQRAPGASRLATHSCTCAGAARRGASQRSDDECTKVAGACSPPK
jgi:hypothetical protein